MIGRAKDELITPDSYLKMYSGDFRMEKIAGSMSFIKRS